MQQYLSRDNKGWKLRRKVPEKLQKVVGKTQWVERLAGADYRQACAKAKTFGVRTDAETKRFEAELTSNPPIPSENSANEPGFKFALT